MSSAIKVVPLQKLRRADELVEAGSVSDIDTLSNPTSWMYDPDTLNSFWAAAAKKYPASDGEKSELDAFMAPRVHMLLRIPRSMAAQPGVWTWAAAIPFRPYMVQRWPFPQYKSWRYTSSNLLRNGIARLWWGAEMLRSGGDYTLVETAFKSVRWFQFVSELRYSMHQESARAFVRALEERNLSDEEAKDLSKRFNVYLRARALEAWDYADDASEGKFDEQWAKRMPKLPDLTVPVEDLEGPSTGVSRTDIEEEILGWLLDVASEAAE